MDLEQMLQTNRRAPRALLVAILEAANNRPVSVRCEYFCPAERFGRVEATARFESGPHTVMLKLDLMAVPHQEYTYLAGEDVDTLTVEGPDLTLTGAVWTNSAQRYKDFWPAYSALRSTVMRCAYADALVLASRGCPFSSP